jgi:polyhydroxyalkanoate synthesis regulator phasin
MIDIYVLGKDVLVKSGEGFTREGAKKYIDNLMAAARADARPKCVAYRFGKFAYTRNF